MSNLNSAGIQEERLEKKEEVFEVEGELVIQYYHPNERKCLLGAAADRIFDGLVELPGTFGPYRVYLRNMRRSED